MYIYIYTKVPPIYMVIEHSFMNKSYTTKIYIYIYIYKCLQKVGLLLI